MLSSLRQAFLLPFWTAQVFSREKFFARNPVIGNRRLNEHGLHTARVIAAYRLAQARRRRLARLIPGAPHLLELPPPAIAVPADTLAVADTFGFNARGPSARPTTRVEIRANGRRNPFLPWTGLDPWALPALGLRNPILYWKPVDLLVRLGRQRWQPRGPVSAFDRA